MTEGSFLATAGLFFAVLFAPILWPVYLFVLMFWTVGMAVHSIFGV